MVDNINDKLKIFYTEEQLNRIGLHILRLIRQRTLRGIDKDGEAFKPYSDKALSLKYGWLTKWVVNDMIKNKEAKMFKSKNGSLYVLIYDGYLAYKRRYMSKSGGFNGVVNLTLTGGMLRGFNVLGTEDNHIILGWSDINLANRAKGNIERGRDFLGLSPADLQDRILQDLLANGIVVFQ